MAINRFSQGPIEADVQSTFIPMPVDMIGKQIERRQGQYDTAKVFIDTTQEAYYGAKGLSPDTESLKNITSAYDTEIESKIKEVGGDYGKLKGYSEALGQKVKKDMMSGQLGAIHNNYVSAINHMEELKDRKAKGDISEEGYNKGLSSISGFGGTVEDGRGGYTKASFYTPTKFVEAGKVADEYGKVLADQFDAKGQKFKNAKTASDLIERNLWNNPEILANAKEQVWATYGDLPPDIEHKAVSAYIDNIAKSAGYKVAYHEVFKPKETEGREDSLFGSTAMVVDLQGAKPLRGMFNVEGTDFFEELSKADNITTTGKAKGHAAFAHITALSEYSFDDKSTNIAEESREDINFEANKRAKESLNKISKSEMMQDIAKAAGINLENADLGTVKKLQEYMDNMNTSSASTRNTYHYDAKHKAEVESFMRSGNFNALRVTNMKTGKDLTTKEKEAVKAEYLTKKEDDVVGYQGTVLEPGQPYPKGTLIFNSNLTDGATPLAVDLAQGTNTFEFLQDRALAAYNSGASWYKNGGNTYQFVKMPNSETVNVYINGERARDPASSKDNPRPLTFKFKNL